MSAVPKTTAVASASPAQSARGVIPTARVASTHSPMVEAMDASANVSFDTTSAGSQDQQTRTDLNHGNGQQQRMADPGANRLFTANTQAFASIFEGVNADRNARPNERQHSRPHGAPVAKAINTYETNALIITGQQPIRGTSFSFNL